MTGPNHEKPIADYTAEDLEAGIAAMASLIGKCEKAQQTVKPGTAAATTLIRRLRAFRLARQILTEKLADLRP